MGIISADIVKGGVDVKSPINWYGGKYYMADEIIKLFPKHKTYVEVFGGGAHILFRKQNSKIEVYNDINEGLYNFFKVLRSNPQEIIKKLQLTPHSRKEFKKSKNWSEEKDDIEKARKFYISTMQAVNTNGGWSYAKRTSRRGMSARTSNWLSKVDKNLVDAVEKLRSIQVENLDFRNCIKKYDSKETLFYLDPPYVLGSRDSKKGYKHEMSNEDHKTLVEILLSIEGKVIISGYENEIYKTIEGDDWNKKIIGEYSRRTVETEKNSYKNEVVWFNFKEENKQQTLF